MEVNHLFDSAAVVSGTIAYDNFLAETNLCANPAANLSFPDDVKVYFGDDNDAHKYNEMEFSFLDRLRHSQVQKFKSLVLST